LIINALVHGDPAKPVTVTAGAEALRVWVEVHNEGPPIPQELQSVLFHPFRRGERESPSPAGLGLGLYISNELVLGHGGQSRFDQPQLKERRFESSCRAKRWSTSTIGEASLRAGTRLRPSGRPRSYASRMARPPYAKIPSATSGPPIQM
jgi:hypothetical protein